MKNYQTIKKTSLIFLLIVFIVQSCTIEKRAFMPGYHIDWRNHKSVPSSTSISEQAKEWSSENVIDSTFNNEYTVELVTENKSETTLNQGITKNEQEQNVADQVVNKEVKVPTSASIKNKKTRLKSTSINQNVIKLNNSINQKKQIDFNDDYGSGLDYFALASFISGILALALIPASILLTISLGVIGLILGIIANSNLSQGDDLYSLNKTFAILGIILNIIAILSPIFYLIYLIAEFL